MFSPIYFSASLLNLKLIELIELESKRSKGLNWVAFAWIPNYDDALAQDRPIEGRKGLKYHHKEYEHQCLLLVFKDWDQRIAQAVDVSWEGSIISKSKFYLEATLANHPQLDKFNVHTVKFIAY